MTALDSQLMTGDDGRERVRFEIGIGAQALDLEGIESELRTFDALLFD